MMKTILTASVTAIAFNGVVDVKNDIVVRA
jgi:hypothetical protein